MSESRASTARERELLQGDGSAKWAGGQLPCWPTDMQKRSVRLDGAGGGTNAKSAPPSATDSGTDRP